MIQIEQIGGFQLDAFFFLFVKVGDSCSCSDKHTICSSGSNSNITTSNMLKFANKICSNDILPFDTRYLAKSIFQNKFKIVKLFWQQIFPFQLIIMHNFILVFFLFLVLLWQHIQFNNTYWPRGSVFFLQQILLISSTNFFGGNNFFFFGLPIVNPTSLFANFWGKIFQILDFTKLKKKTKL